MKINCVWEHNGNDTLLHAIECVGAFSRGESKEIALSKMENEIRAYLRWQGAPQPDAVKIAIAQEWATHLDVCDADSDAIFDEEKAPLSRQEYLALKALALKSAEDFLRLFEAMPDPKRSVLLPKKTFLGFKPLTAQEMYVHTRCVNSYYFGEINVDADREGTILDCRQRGFDALEQQENFLSNPVFLGSGDEYWSLRKVLRRFIWHDRIHGKAMYRMAEKTFGQGSVPDIFRFFS